MEKFMGSHALEPVNYQVGFLLLHLCDNRFYPSNKTCNVCGWINQDLNLSVREWTCKNGHHLDRDENAAKNILNEGLRIISAGTLQTE
jgi:transposase